MDDALTCSSNFLFVSWATLTLSFKFSRLCAIRSHFCDKQSRCSLSFVFSDVNFCRSSLSFAMDWELPAACSSCRRRAWCKLLFSFFKYCISAVEESSYTYILVRWPWEFGWILTFTICFILSQSGRLALAPLWQLLFWYGSWFEFDAARWSVSNWPRRQSYCTKSVSTLNAEQAIPFRTCCLRDASSCRNFWEDS